MKINPEKKFIGCVASSGSGPLNTNLTCPSLASLFYKTNINLTYIIIIKLSLHLITEYGMQNANRIHGKGSGERLLALTRKLKQPRY